MIADRYGLLLDRNVHPAKLRVDDILAKDIMFSKNENYIVSGNSDSRKGNAGTGLAATNGRESSQSRDGGSQKMPSDQDRHPSSRSERRLDRRLEIRLPIECRLEGENGACVVRTITQNVSSGGMYIELDSPDFKVGDRLRIELTVPAAEGVSPYPGRATCAAEVLRIEPIASESPDGLRRFGIASRFLDKLKISY